MRRALGLSLLFAGIATGFVAPPAALAAPPDDPAATSPAPLEARAHFAAGTAAAHRGDYAVALEAFRAAESAGLAGPVVAYNIGVCAWELGLLDEAEAAFLRASTAPDMAAVAYYNLGLVRREHGDEAGAQAWFQRARDSAADDALRQLAMAQLADEARREARVPAPVAPPARAVGFAVLQAGYDDNVALVADGEIIGVTDTGSAFLEAQFAGAFPLAHGLRAEASAYVLRYPSLDEFDQSGGRLGVVARRAVSDWTGELGLDLGFNRLDTERFEDRIGLSFIMLRPLEAGWDLRLRYRYEDISGRGQFKSLTGDRHEFALRLRHRVPGRRIRLEYRMETNDRAGDAVSPDRHRVEAEALFDVARNLQATASLGWRHSRFATANGDRSERRATGAAGLLGPLTHRLNWLVRVELLDNDASLSDFDYRQHRVFAGVEGIF